MGLKMPTPTKRPRSQFFQFRRGTPADLWRAKDRLAALGVAVTREATKSLKTSDPSEGKRLQAEALVRWQVRWDSWRKLLRDGPRVLSQKEVFAISAEMARDIRQQAEENPGDAETWHNVADGIVEAPIPEVVLNTYRAGLKSHLSRRYGWDAVADESIEMLLAQFVSDLPRVAGDLEALAKGDYREREWHNARPKGGMILKTKQQSTQSEDGAASRKIVTFTQLLESWERTRGPSSSSVRAYKGRLKDFTQMLGHDDAAKVTRDDAHRWVEAMQAAAVVSDETIRDKLAALSAVLRWGVEQRLLERNVAEHVKLRKRLDRSLEKPRRDFTDEEAVTILTKARGEKGFLRWGPFVMAYAGMRVGEVAQLRRQDVVRERGGRADEWTIIINPEAGHVKGHKRREVPVHSALVKEGFLTFVLGCAEGSRLFPELYSVAVRAKHPHKISNHASAVMRRWVRSKHVLDTDDKSIGPSHSWRHYFNTRSREHGLDREVRKTMVGHLDEQVAESYGSTRGSTKRRQMEKLPAIKGKAKQGN